MDKLVLGYVFILELFVFVVRSLGARAQARVMLDFLVNFLVNEHPQAAFRMNREIQGTDNLIRATLSSYV